MKKQKMSKGPELKNQKFEQDNNTFFWNLYARCYDSIYHLMPYRKLLWDVLQSLDLKPGMKILDAGCGTGNFELFISEKNIPSVEIEAIDFSPIMLSRAMNKCKQLDYVNFKLANLNQNLNYPNSSFDRILCLNILHSLKNKLFSLRELSRILKPGGRIIIVDPKPDYKTTPIVRDHFERVSNIWGLSRKFFVLIKTVMLLPIPFTLLPILYSLRNKRGPDASTKYHFLPGKKLATLLKQNSFRILEIKSTYAGQNWSIRASKINPKRNKSGKISIFAKYAETLSLHPSGEEPIRGNPNIELLDLDKATNEPAILKLLVKSYREIFGSPDIWGEGAYCNINPNHLIPLPEYEKRIKAGNLRCDCGGRLIPCYPPSSLKNKILSQLTPTKNEKPFCAIMRYRNKIEGFTWGVVAPVAICLRRIFNSRYCITNVHWEKQIQRLSKTLNKLNLQSDDELLFVDELAITPEARQGIAPFISLVRTCFEHGFENDCQTMLFWTVPKSPIYKFARLAGFQEVLRTPDGIVFLYCDDIIPILVVMQNKEPCNFLSIFVSAARDWKRTAQLKPKIKVLTQK